MLREGPWSDRSSRDRSPRNRPATCYPAANPDCVTLTPENVASLGWLPGTCAYRLLDEGKPLAWWHPLVSGRQDTVAEAGISVGGAAYSEIGLSVDALVDHIWKLPKAKRRVFK